VTKTTATLHGVVDAHGASTAISFEYADDRLYNEPGATSPYDHVVNGSNVSDDGQTAVSLPVSALAPGTTYHFRLVAENAAGTVYGADLTFTTAPK
jgi:hypothetical protein